MPTRKTTEQFIEKATKLHGGRYDYSKTMYVSSWKKIVIVCDTHGEFLQAPANHIKGRNGKGQGCPHCMAVENLIL